MKRILTILTILFMGTTAVFAAASVGEKQRDPGYISVYSEAEDEIAPNVAQVTFSVETSDVDANKASAKNKEITNKAIAAIKPLINEKYGETIKTTGFNLDAVYSYRNNKRTFENYKVVNSFEVKVKDVSKLGKILNTGINAGATDVGALRYSVDVDSRICNDLIAKAGKEAKTSADFIAKSIGLRILSLKQAQTSCSTQSAFPRPYLMKGAMGAEDSASADVPTEAGTIKIKASFSAQFYVGQ
jgi:uncharacterized protein YggE